MSYMDTVVLKRSLRVWWSVPIAALVALDDWHGHVTGAWAHHPRRYGGSFILVPLTLGMVIYDLYARLIRRDRLEFSEAGILDQASSDRLGEIRWDAVETVTVSPTLLGANVVIGFKDGVALNDRVEQWDNLRAGPLAVSADDQQRILQLAAERKINSSVEK